MTTPHRTVGARDGSDQAAIFVDYDNLFSILESQSSDRHHSSEYASEILSEVRRYLEEGDDTPTLLSRAYADFAGLPDGDGAKLQSLLYRDGVDPVMTPGVVQDNASELRLCLDVCSVLHERPDVRTVVLVTGDRPYLPLVRQIRESGRRALVAAVNPPRPSGGADLAEDDVYLDARNLLSQPSRDALLANAPSQKATQSRSGSGAPPRRYRDITNPVARETIEITEEHFGQYDEVYLTPLLRKLSDVLGEQHDPKSLVSELEAAGAVRLEKRDGYPYDYTVLIVNEDHPGVQEIQDDYYNRRSSYDGNGVSEYASDYERVEAEADADRDAEPAAREADPAAPSTADSRTPDEGAARESGRDDLGEEGVDEPAADPSAVDDASDDPTDADEWDDLDR